MEKGLKALKYHGRTAHRKRRRLKESENENHNYFQETPSLDSALAFSPEFENTRRGEIYYLPISSP